MKIFGCGDIFVAKRLPKAGYDGFDAIRKLIRSHDACFGNLETTVHNNEGYPSKFPGGGVRDGFTIVSCGFKDLWI